MRKKDDTMRETLLECARQLAQTDGPDAINIRTIAQQAGIATGTVYNYFSSKEEILFALIEQYWNQTLLELQAQSHADPFPEQVEHIYQFLRDRIRHPGAMLMGSLGTLEAAGQERMESMQAVLRTMLLEQIEQDSAIPHDLWTATFSKEQYVRFLMRNLMMLLRTRDADIDFLIELIRRTIYR